MKASQSHIKTYCSRWLTAGLLTIVSFSIQAGIVGSKHDLKAAGSDANEVCVYCHTPHGSDTTAAVPLWNKVLTPGAAYQRYSALGTASLDGSENTIGSVSLACLSCHDGTQARDVVINAPGSTADNTLLYEPTGISLGTAAAMTNVGTDKVPMLGLDLRDDHPISIPYAGGGCSTAEIDGSTCTSAIFLDNDFNTAFKDTINGQPVWWLDDGDGVREKQEMQLYTRKDNIAAGEPSVECGSCHDPHNNDTGTYRVAFLRIDNASSAICTSCHNK